MLTIKMLVGDQYSQYGRQSSRRVEADRYEETSAELDDPDRDQVKDASRHHYIHVDEYITCHVTCKETKYKSQTRFY